MCTKSQYILSKTNKQEIIILQVSYLLAYSSAFKVYLLAYSSAFKVA